MSTQPPAASYISDAGRFESEMKQAFEDLVSLIKELPGGTNASSATVLASDTFSVVANICAYAIDTQGAAATDDLRWVGGTPRDGQIIFVGGYNAGRINTIRHAAGGAGQIYTLDGTDFVLRDINMFVPLRYNLGATAWYMLDFPETFRINQMPGGKAAATLTMAANAATPTQALHALDTSGGAAEDLRILTQTTANRDIQLLTLYGANAGHVPTLKHAYGGNGQIYMNDSADFALSGNRTITLRRNGNQWNEVFRTVSNVPLPVSTATGKMLNANTAGGWKETGGTLAKGAIPVGLDGNDFGYLAVGANGTIPVADSTQATGIKWDNPTSGGSLYGDGADGAKTISSNTTETVPKIFRLTTLTIQTGCTWTVKSGTLILCTGAVDIQGTGKLVVANDIPGGVAAAAEYGPFTFYGGGPSPGSCPSAGTGSSASGGGCGGAGGNGGWSTNGVTGAGGAALYPYPGVTGSGGGTGHINGSPGNNGSGGTGAGSVGLYSGSTITIGASAKITANGGAGANQSGAYGIAGGGGSGGVIDIGALTSITNSGTIEAKGGAGGNAVNSGNYGAGGGGGIVCLTSASITAGTITLTGGAKGSGGAGYSGGADAQAGSTGVTYSTTAAPVKYRCF